VIDAIKEKPEESQISDVTSGDGASLDFVPSSCMSGKKILLTATNLEKFIEQLGKNQSEGNKSILFR
jgi:hypothetical protein